VLLPDAGDRLHREQHTRLAGYRSRQMPVRSDAEAAAYQAAQSLTSSTSQPSTRAMNR
jgi:hypothetical protein